MALEVKINIADAVKGLANAFDPDDKLMIYAHTRLAAYCQPYVPMQTGVLANTLSITPNYLEYTAPYAHYQYAGEVYGPNIPIMQANGTIAGWFSPPGMAKHPTGRSITYSTELHPLATDHWDQAAMQARGDDLTDELARYIIRRYRQT